MTSQDIQDIINQMEKDQKEIMEMLNKVLEQFNQQSK